MALDARRVPGGVEVVATAPIDAVRITGPGVDVSVARRASPTLFVPLSPPRGVTLRVEAGGAVDEVRVPALPAELWLELPTGSPAVWLAPGDVLVRAGDPAAPATLRLESVGDGAVVRVGDRVLTLGPPGTRVAVPVPSAVTDLEVDGGGDAFTVSWRLERGPPVTIADARFPVGADGRPEPGRADGVAVIPPASLRRDAPWGHAAVALHNPAPSPVTVAVALSFGGPGFGVARPGAPERAVVATLPAGGGGDVVLPVYVDPRAARDGPLDARVTVVDVATGAPLAARAPGWRAVRPDGALTLFVASLPLSLAGLALLGVGGRRFLAATPVPVLTLVACLAAVTFVVGAAFQLVGFGVAAALGPFAPFVTGLFDDLFRVALLGALVTRVPRPGVVSAAAVVGFLMRGLALGGLHPADLLYLGNQVALGEGFLWLAGLTRSDAWKSEGRLRRTARLALGFAPAQAAGAALGLVASSALYRLYWDPWYAAALVLLPGGLYVGVAAVLAAPLAAELDRVAE